MTVVRIAKKYLGESEAVRQYGILSGKVEGLILFPLSFNIALTTTLIPAVSQFKARGETNKAKYIIKLAILVGILIGIPCFICVFIYAEDILKILFPNASDGSIMLKYSSITIIIAIVAQTINSYLQGMHKMGIQIISISIGCVIKLILNIILISNKQIGIYGAVASNIISYAIMLIILAFYLIKKEKISFELNKFFVKPVILTISMYIILKSIHEINIVNSKVLKFGLNVFVGAVIYILLIILFRMISKKDLKIAQNSRHKTWKALKIGNFLKK